MSVMRCCRKGCDNIMCDTYIESFGYICEDCKREFKEFLINKNSIAENIMTKGEIMQQLKVFNISSKGDNKKMTIDEFFG